MSRLTDRHQTYRTSGASGGARNPSSEYFVLKNVENLVEMNEKNSRERFKGKITYMLLFCILGVSFRGATQNFRTDSESSVIRPVFHR